MSKNEKNVARGVDIKHSILYSRFRHRKTASASVFPAQKEPRVSIFDFQFFKAFCASSVSPDLYTGNQPDHRGIDRMDRSSRSPRPVRTAPTGRAVHDSASGEIAFVRTHAAADAVQAPCMRTRVWLHPAAENRAGRHPFPSGQSFKKRDESCFATVKFAGFPLIIRIFRLIFRRARCTLFSLYVFSYSLTITDSPIPNERGG